MASFWERLQEKFKEGTTKQTLRETLAGEAGEPEESGPDLSQWYTYGAHLYRQKGEVAKVVFSNREKGIRRVIVDDSGLIHNFPGIEDEDKIREHLNEGSMQPRIRFRTDFCKKPDGRIMMIWEIQPDGRYWEDEDGFGGESDAEIRLYTYLDERGRFTGPFRLYNIGVHKYVQEQ